MKKNILIFILILLISNITSANTINLSVNNLEIKGEQFIFSGDVEITKDNIVLNSKAGDYLKDEEKLKLFENVVLESNDFKISSNDMEGLLKDNTYIFRENVNMNNINEDKENFTLKSDLLYLYSDTNNFNANGNISIEYKDKILTSDKAEYINETERLTLLENVVINNKDGEKIISDKVVINLNNENENFEATGRVNITLTLDD